MPTSIGVFDPVVNATQSFQSMVNAVPIQDSVVFAIAQEAHRSSLLWAIERFTISRVTSQGFTLEVQLQKQIAAITDALENPFLHDIWETTLQGILTHCRRNGYAAVCYRPIAGKKLRTGKPASQRTRKREQEEYSGGEEGEEPPSSEEEPEEEEEEEERIPQLLDPVTEYYVKFLTAPTGQRAYLAFPRNSPVSLTDPIPHSRVFVFHDPEADGHINSPIQRCLEELQQLRGFLEREEIRDYRLSNPPYVYVPQASGAGIIPNQGLGKQDIELPVADFEDPLTPAQEQQLRSMQSGKSIGKPTSSQPEYYKQIQAQANRYIADAIFRSPTSQGGVDRDLNTLHYNAQLGRWCTIDPINSFNPFIVLPQHVALAPNVPQPGASPQFQYMINTFLRQIANATGVPPEFVLGEHAKVTADVQFSSAHLDSTVRELQRRLERVVAQMYIDIYAKAHRAHIQQSIRTARQQNQAQERRAAAREELEKEIAAALKTEEETEEANAKAEQRSKRLALQDRLNALGEPNPVKSRPVDQRSAGYANLQPGTVESLMDEHYQIELERRLKVVVKFNDNPTMTLGLIRELQQLGAITTETARSLALKLHGLSPKLLATDAELDSEARALAKRQKILQPPDAKKPGASAGKADGSQPAGGSAKPQVAKPKE